MADALVYPAELNAAVTIYRRADGSYGWRMVGPSGAVLATSSEGYVSRDAAITALGTLFGPSEHAADDGAEGSNPRTRDDVLGAIDFVLDSLDAAVSTSEAALAEITAKNVEIDKAARRIDAMQAENKRRLQALAAAYGE